jgi:hypothetical protein
MQFFGNFFPKPAVVAVCSLVLVSCGDDEATQAGADWLKANHQVPVNSGWKLKDVQPAGKGELEIIVDLYSATNANKLNTLSAMDKGEVARLACPMHGTEFQGIVGPDATVVVKLTNMGKTLVSAVCRR